MNNLFSTNSSKQLIVNADDFGMCIGVNEGIIFGHTNGIITSTTLMANGSAFDDAIVRAKDFPRLGIGCHLVLLGGTSISSPNLVRSLINSNQEFPNDFRKFIYGLITRKIKQEEILIEFRSQIEKIQKAGITLSHLDSHKHTHAHPLVLDVVLRVAEEYKIPYIRNPFEKFWYVPLSMLSSGFNSKKIFFKQFISSFSLVKFALYFKKCLANSSIKTSNNFYGFMHTGLLTPQLIESLLCKLPLGTNELMCHPGIMDDTLLNYKTRLKESRVTELEALTSSKVINTVKLKNIFLVNYNELALSQ